jgi:hypothetical protein
MSMPSEPRPFATMWAQYKGAEMKVRVIRKREGDQWECREWNHPDRVIFIARENLSYKPQ